MKKYDKCIITSNANYVGAGISYMPYLLFAGLEGENYIVENEGITKANDIPDAKEYYVFYGSRIQEGQVSFLVNVVLPEKNKPIYVFGYEPFIEEARYDLYRVTKEVVEKGMAFLQRKYVHQTKKFLRAMCDCDGHIKDMDCGDDLYPFYTSFGCQNPCTFCPVPVWSKNCCASLPIEEVRKQVEFYSANDMTNIHFIDEDLFSNTIRASQVLSIFMEYNFNCIIQGTVRGVLRFIEDYGVSVLEDAGVRLLEIGLESVSLNKKMGKKGEEDYKKLKELLKDSSVEILFLCITFFPGETVESLNVMGEFLEKYGQDPANMSPRVITNGTVGGLGQFFLPYPGTKAYKDIRKEGEVLTDNGIRLFPSFIPNSFKDCAFEMNKIANQKENLLFWMKVYNIPESYIVRFFQALHYNIRKCIQIFIENICFDAQFKEEKVYILLALLARLRIIIPKEHNE